MRFDAILATAAVLITSACHAGAPADLVSGSGGSGYYSVATYTKVGTPVSVGAFVAQRGSRNVVLRSIKLVGNHGLTLVGVSVTGPERSPSMIGTEDGYPPKEYAGRSTPVAGVAVPPRSRDPNGLGLAVTFGLQLDRPGRGFATGYDVTYSVDGQVRHRAFVYGIGVCATRDYEAGGPAIKPPCDALPNPRKR